jgi:hypothetical protein
MKNERTGTDEKIINQGNMYCNIFKYYDYTVLFATFLTCVVAYRNTVHAQLRGYTALLRDGTGMKKKVFIF